MGAVFADGGKGRGPPLPGDRLLCSIPWPLSPVLLLCRLLHPALSPSSSGPQSRALPRCSLSRASGRRAAVSSGCPVRHEHFG